MIERNKYSMRNIINENITEYIDQRFQPINQSLWKIRLDAEGKYIPIIQRDVESFLITLLNISRPTKILEIGTAIGYSSAIMAKTLPNCYIKTLEKNKDMIDRANKNFENLGVNENIEIVYGDARKELLGIKDSISEDKDKFEFVFIDAAKSHYMEFWNIIVNMIKPGAIIVCDNVLMRGMTVDSAYDIHNKHRTNIKKMREFIDYIIGIENVQTSLLPIGDGVTVSYIKE